MEDETTVDETPVMPISFNPKAVKPVSREELLPSNRGGLILCLGIVGVSVCCLGIILGPIAIVMGRSDLMRMKNDEMSDSGRLAVVIGLILGILSTLLGIAAVVLSVSFFNWVSTVDLDAIDRRYEIEVPAAEFPESDLGYPPEEDPWDAGEEASEGELDTRIPVEIDEVDVPEDGSVEVILIAPDP